MDFWKGNRIDGHFELPASEVAARFLKWYRAQPEDSLERSQRLEVALRYWLSVPAGLDSAWEAEHGGESLEDVLSRVLAALDEEAGAPS